MASMMPNSNFSANPRPQLPGRTKRRACSQVGLYRGQSLAAHPPTIGEDAPTALGRIPTQKPMLSHTANFRRLILTFHDSRFSSASWRQQPTGPAHIRIPRNTGPPHSCGRLNTISEPRGVKLATTAYFIARAIACHQRSYRAGTRQDQTPRLVWTTRSSPPTRPKRVIGTPKSFPRANTAWA